MVQAKSSAASAHGFHHGAGLAWCGLQVGDRQTVLGDAGRAIKNGGSKFIGQIGILLQAANQLGDQAIGRQSLDCTRSLLSKCKTCATLGSPTRSHSQTDCRDGRPKTAK